MLSGLAHVRKATMILAEHNGTSKDRLNAARAEFYVSLIEEDQWPSGLLQQAKALDSKLQRLEGLNQIEVRDAIHDLVDLNSQVDAFLASR